MACRIAPNGQTSSVHKAISKIDASMADDVFLTIHSNEFRNWYGDWRTIAEELAMEDSQSLLAQHRVIKHGFNGKLDPKTLEPKVYFLTNKTESLPKKSNIKVDKSTSTFDEIDNQVEDFAAGLNEVTFDIGEDFIVLSETYSKGSSPVFVNSAIPNGSLADLEYSSVVKVGNKIVVSDPSILRNATDMGIVGTTFEELKGTNTIRNILNNVLKTNDNIILGDSLNSQLDNKSNKLFKFEDLSLVYNLNKIKNKSNLFEQFIPAIVHTISGNETEFDNIYYELVESNEDQIKDIREEVRKYLGFKPEFTQKKEILSKAIIKYNNMFDNEGNLLSDVLSSNELLPHLSARINQLRVNFEGKVNEVLNTNESYSTNDTVEETTKKVVIKELGKESKSPKKIEQSIDKLSNQLSFDDSPIMEDGKIKYNDLLGVVEQNHTYYDTSTQEALRYSVSDIKAEHKSTKFQELEIFKAKFIQDTIRNKGEKIPNMIKWMFQNKNADGTWNKKLNSQLAESFHMAIRSGDLESFFEKFPKEDLVEILKKFKPQVTETIKEIETQVLEVKWKGIPTKTVDVEVIKQEAETDAQYEARLNDYIESSTTIAFEAYRDQLRDWAARPYLGTKIHRIAEAILKEDYDKKKENDTKSEKILAYLDSIPSLIKSEEAKVAQIIKNLDKNYPGLSKELKDIVKNLLNDSSLTVAQRLKNIFDKNKTYVAIEKTKKDGTAYTYYEKLGGVEDGNKLKSDLSPILSKLVNLTEQQQMYEDLKALKQHIKSKGGIIKTEVVVHSDKFYSIDGQERLRVGGQIDVLAIYEDKEGVDESYRGTVEIYDFKTMKWKPKETKELFEIKNGSSKGYHPRDQEEHALQQALYARILEVELGLTVKDTFIIPISTPNIYIGKKEVEYTDKDGNKVMRSVPDIRMLNGFTFIQSNYGKASDTDFPLAYNTKTFLGHELTEYGNKTSYKGHLEAVKIAEARLPFDDDIDPNDSDDIKAKKKKQQEERARKEAEKEVNKKFERKASGDIEKLVIEIRKHIEARMMNLKSKMRTSDNKEDLKFMKNRLETLKTELSDLSDLHKVWRFAIDAADEVLGYKDDSGYEVVSLSKSFKEALVEYHQKKNDKEVDKTNLLSKTIGTLDDIRVKLNRQKKILTKVKNVLDSSDVTSKDDADYKRIVEAIEEMEDLEGKYYSEAENLMAETLAQFISEDATNTLENLTNSQLRRYEKDKKALAQKLKEGSIDQTSYENKIKSLDRKIDKTKKTNEQLTLDKESLLKDMTQLQNDISFVHRWLNAPIASSDMLTSLYAKMLKFKMSEAEIVMNEEGVKMQKIVDDLLANIPEKNIELDAESFFDPILETRHAWKTVYIKDENGNDTKEYELVPVTSLLSEYGTIEHTLANGAKGQFGHDIIYADFIHKLSDARENKTRTEYLKVKREFDKWKEKYMEKEYKDGKDTESGISYYDLAKLMDDDIGQIALKELQKIDDEISLIKEGSEGDNEIELDPDEIKRIKQLEVSKRKLRSLYDDKGNLKKDTAAFPHYSVAKKLQERSELWKELHDFDINHNLFEKRLNQVMKDIQMKYKSLNIPVTQTPEYFQWLDNNQDNELTENFYDHVKMLTIKRDMSYYASYYADQDIKKFLSSLAVVRANDAKFIELATELLESKGLSLDSIKKSDPTFEEITELREKINRITKPYKIDNNEVDHSILPEEVRLRVRDLHEEIEDMMDIIKNRKDNRSKQEKARQAQAAKESKTYKEALAKFRGYVPTNAYWKEYYAVANANPDTDIERTSWYRKNHYFSSSTNQMEPINIWLRQTHEPSEANKVANTTYKIDKQEQLKNLAKIYSDKDLTRDATFFKQKLKQTSWYKQHHTVTGAINPNSNFYLAPNPDNYFVKQQPNSKYSKSIVKEEYKRNREDVYDERGNLKPKKHMWKNEKYEQLKNEGGAWFKALESFTDMYQRAQSVLPDSDYMGNVLPFTQKDKYEILASKKGFKEKSEQIFNNIKEGFTSSVFDVEDQGEKLIYNQGIDERSIHMPYTKRSIAPQDQVSKNVVGSLMKFMKAAYKKEAIGEIMAETRTLLAIVNRREGEEGQGTVREDRRANGIANKLGLAEFARKDNRSQAAQLLEDFVLAQIFNEMNTPVDFTANIPFFGEKTIRIDKLADQMSAAAAFTQIGGIGSTAWLKGVANGLQAEIQMLIEKAAGRYYAKGTWRNAKWKTYQAGKDALKDMGKIHATTLSGQLGNIYDPMQGDFVDEYGNNVSGSMFHRVRTGGSWFFNQYIGEWNVAMHNLYATLGSHKLVEKEDGTYDVYNIQDYLAMKSKELGRDLTRKEKTEFKAEHAGLSQSLADAYELGEDGVIKVKDGVNWEIGSKRDLAMKTRMHAIARELQGNYSKFDMPMVQKSFAGKLLMMYKKYLIPALRRRFGSIRRDESLEDIREGYHRTFFKLFGSDFKRLADEFTQNIILRRDKETGLSDLEIENVKRSLTETAIIGTLFLLVMALEPGEDENKGEISAARYAALYEALRLRKEMGATWINPWWTLTDNYKVLSSPTAINGTVERFLKFLYQLTDPTAEYKRDYGIAEKGDNKAWIKFRKLMGTVSVPIALEPTTVRESYENLTRGL